MFSFPESTPSRFVGREAEIKLLKQHLIHGKTKVANIFGDSGVGKTSLALVFAKIFEGVTSGQAVRINLTPFSEHQLYELVMSSVYSRSKQNLIIIDDFDFSPYPKLDAEIRQILTSLPNTRILIVSRRKLQSRSVDLVVSLGNLSMSEMLELILMHAERPLSMSEVREIYQKIRGNPLASNLIGGLLKHKLSSVAEFLKSLEPFQVETPLGPNGHPLEPESERYDLIVAEVTSVSDELLRKLSENPRLLYEITPRLFEEVVAEIFQRQGYDVTLTPISRDGGKDIYVATKNMLGSFLYVVECKQYSPDNAVGVGLIRQLYGVVQAERATAGILATTSYFTKDAEKFQKQVKYQLSLRDYVGVQQWLKETHWQGR